MEALLDNIQNVGVTITEEHPATIAIVARDTAEALSGVAILCANCVLVQIAAFPRSVLHRADISGIRNRSMFHMILCV
jgi:hypothetical protein